MALAALAALAACGPAPPEEPASAPPAAEIAVPDPLLDGMEVPVAEAIGTARDAVRSDPSSALAWGAYGATLQAHRLLTEAVVAHDRASALDGTDFRWPYLAAIAREVQSAPADELETRFRRAIALRPDYPAAYIRLGDALSIRGAAELALDAYRDALELDPDLTAGHRGLGQALLAMGDVERARKHLAVAAGSPDADGATFAALAQALRRIGLEEEAAEAARRGAAAGTATSLSDPVFRDEVIVRGASASRALTRAESRLRAGDVDGALRDLAIAERARPLDSSIHLLTGVALERRGDVSGAIERFARAAELEPERAEAYRRWGRALAASGNAADGVARLRRATDLAPGDAAAWSDLGEAHARAGDVEGVIAAYERARALGRRDITGTLNLAVAYTRESRHAEALPLFREAAEARPDDAEIQFRLGRCYEDTGRFPQARAAYERALGIDPGHAGALRRLTRLRSQRP